jgi:polysaccharide deacetylase 2 family uncharacterized protein YibQ
MAVKKKGTLPKKRTPKKPVPRKKTGSRRVKKQKRPKQRLLLNELKKNLLGILILLSICLTIAMVADIFLKPGRSVPPDNMASQTKPHQKKTISDRTQRPVHAVKKTPLPEPAAKARKEIKPIAYEVFTDIAPVIIEAPRPVPKDTSPRIAIIIDDIGYDHKMALALYDLHPNITFSVLPFSPFGRQISRKLHEKGAQLMLHLPMEPDEYPHVDPGPGAILSQMTPDQLLAQLKKDIADVPFIVGVNNHMGSKLTASADQMNQIFTILKKEKLFFIDSKTAPRSQGKAAARLLKVRFAQRDVFLDNFQDMDYISGQFNQLIGIARRHGSAIGIGHPYQTTLEALGRLLPKIKKKIKVVRASELVHVPG